MKTIVVATDFSPISLNAVNYAADMSCVIGTNLSLLHVCPLLVFSEIPVSPYDIERQIAEAEQNMNKLEEQIMYRTMDRIKISTAVKLGDLIEGINNYCTSVNPYAVVLGAENANVIEKMLSGAKTLSAVKQLLWPLIVIPPDVTFTCIRKIGLACDFKKVVETIPIKEIKILIKEFQSELHVLHVSEDEFTPEVIEESSYLYQILEELKPKYHFIKNSDIEKGIIEFVEKNNIDFLIILPKKHNLFNKVFKHSHSKRLVLHSHVPVMSVHE